MPFIFSGLIALSFMVATPALATNAVVYEISSTNSTANMTAPDVIAGLDWASDLFTAGGYKTGKVAIHSASRHISTDYTWKGAGEFVQGAIYCDNGWTCDIDLESVIGTGPPTHS